jgi:ATP-dependent Zn protease
VIPAPSLYGAEEALKKEDVVSRRRTWYWRHKFKVWLWIGAILLVIFILVALFNGISLADAPSKLWNSLKNVQPAQFAFIGIQVFALFFINFFILFGPMVFLGIQQIKAYEPGDADWGVKLADVRGQAEAKREITRVVSLWQSGEEFEKAGGKRERGVLFLGAPGTGKTMLSKGIATSFNCPFVTIPGSGFAQTFIGMDAIIVRFLARRAKKLAAKWGGQCIVFIDEIDAVGMRRSSLGSGFEPVFADDTPFYGPWGALNSSGDLVLETPAWRERLFASRAEAPRQIYPAFITKINNALKAAIIPGGMMGMGGGGLALNQLLVVMDGIDDPPFTKRVFTRRFNTFLDALYVIPQKLFGLRLRFKPPKPRKEQVYFIGACNVPLESLDPALTRPGRMGRHIYFRTPTWEDRRDIFDLYMDKVAHEEELDTAPRRDEIARITNGYSPAMIDQVCSMALTNAQHEGKVTFGWEHLLQAMTTLESGTAINVSYPEHELRSVAIHEAGHAVTAHVYRPDLESSRLSTRMRGGSLGHHQTFEREERFSRWQHEEIGTLVHVLGAMAAENVFYGENTGGVGGDLQTATDTAAWMVGTAGMRPLHVDLDGSAEDEDAEEAHERIMKRFERNGRTLMNRTRGSADFHADPIAAILRDPFKHAVAAQILGQAYVMAVNLVAANKDAVDAIATHLAERRELYGDELVELLDRQELVKPELDYTKEETWPRM